MIHVMNASTHSIVPLPLDPDAQCQTERDRIALAGGHDVALVRDALLNLDSTERTVLSLYYFEELTLQEIGLVMRITTADVAQLHATGLAAVQGSLALQVA